jgi:hypothetical protein
MDRVGLTGDSALPPVYHNQDNEGFPAGNPAESEPEMNEVLRLHSMAGIYEAAETVWVAGARPGMFDMTIFARRRGAVLAPILAAVLINTLILPAGGLMAAPMRAAPHFRLGGGGMGLFNLDPSPCGAPGFRLRGRGDSLGDCPDSPQRRLPRQGRNATRGPGSSAFGLQFDLQGD